MKFPLWESIRKKKLSPEQEIALFLKETELFGNLKGRVLREITSLVHKRSYKEGEVVFEQGQAGAGLYLIMSGKVRIVAKANEQEMMLAELEKYSFFGELSLFDIQPRGATAIAADDSILLGFFQPELKRIIEQKPKIGIEIIMAITKVIAFRLNNTNQVLEQGYARARKKKSI